MEGEVRYYTPFGALEAYMEVPHQKVQRLYRDLVEALKEAPLKDWEDLYGRFKRRARRLGITLEEFEKLWDKAEKEVDEWNSKRLERHLMSMKE